MPGEPDLAAVGALLGDPHRAAFLLALFGGHELAARELAARADASPSLASSHLAKLLDGGLVQAERRGRSRYYRIAGPEVATAIEALLSIAPPRAGQSLREATRGEVMRRARTCYDHLAGRLGVALTEALERERVLVGCDSGWELTASGEDRLEQLGIDMTALRQARRPLIRSCLDWSERRPHLAGSLGAALAGRLLDLGWVRRLPGTRALAVTTAGEHELRATFALQLPA